MATGHTFKSNNDADDIDIDLVDDDDDNDDDKWYNSWWFMGAVKDDPLSSRGAICHGATTVNGMK